MTFRNKCSVLLRKKTALHLVGLQSKFHSAHHLATEGNFLKVKASFSRKRFDQKMDCEHTFCINCVNLCLPALDQMICRVI